MLNKVVNWLIARAKKTPYENIYNRKGELYMERLWLIPYNRWVPAVRIHTIHLSDDRVFHDHPWYFISIILRGGYREVRPTYDKSGIYLGDESKWYGAGSVLFRRPKDLHRLEINARVGAATTLFITGKWRQRWGFVKDPMFKVYHRNYRG